MLAVVYLEEGGALQHTGGAAHLPDGVHGQLRGADVHHGNAETGRQDGSDGGPTGAVVTNHHILQGGGGDNKRLALCNGQYSTSFIVAQVS